MSSEAIIACRGVGKRFQTYERPFERLVQLVTGREYRSHEEFVALKDVSFELRRGESLGIIGTNGSGKSTLLQIVSGTLQPSEGEVRVNARIAALLELGAGFNADFTGRENVYLNGALMGLSTREIDHRFDSIAAFADIGDHMDMPVKTYSSGMYVRLAFSIAAHVDADTLVIDEALSVGDVRFAQKCMRFLRSFRERGSLLFVSHDPGAVVGLCDRAIWLDRGRLRMDGEAKHVVETYLAEQHAIDRASVGEHVVVGATRARTLIDEVELDVVDPRAGLIDRSNLRNVLRVIHPEPRDEGSSFGAGQATIVATRLLDTSAQPIMLFLGGERVTLAISFEVHEAIDSPIVGFYVKDRLGQRLFGDNTFLSYLDSPLRLERGDRVCAKFEFRMPRMPSGDYTVDVAIATGSQEDHTQQHWIHDALVFRATDESMRSGLMGIPMLSISMEREAMA